MSEFSHLHPEGSVRMVDIGHKPEQARRAIAAAQLIPLCHPLPLNYVAVDFEVGEKEISIRCEVATRAPTGVEMEALTGVAVAALTLYDMMKSADKTMRIEGIELVSKEKK
jgi:cyclic pyranopterin monophosphate synthase